MNFLNFQKILTIKDRSLIFFYEQAMKSYTWDMHHTPLSRL